MRRSSSDAGRLPVCHKANMTPEQEIWAVALWVEKHHGTDGPTYITRQIGRLALDGDKASIVMWKKVAVRFSKLQRMPPPIRS